MKKVYLFSAIISLLVLTACIPLINKSGRFTVVEVNVDPPLSVAVYVYRPGSTRGTRICSQISTSEKCRLYESTADGQTGIILQAKPLAYPECPLVSPEMVSSRCWNSEVIYWSEGDTLVLNVRYPLNFTWWTIRMGQNPQGTQ